MRKTTKSLTGITAACLALTLSSCGGEGEPRAYGAASPTAENPTLSVPETTEGKSISFTLDPGTAPAGQDYHIGLFNAGSSGTPLDCFEEIRSVDGQFGDQETSGTLQVNGPGEYQLVLSTEDHTSSCQDPKARTTVKVKP